MIITDYINKNQSSVKILQQKNTQSIDKTVPKFFIGITASEDVVLKYKSEAILDDPTALEDKEIKVKKGQMIAIFDEPFIMPEKKLSLYKETTQKGLLNEHIKELFTKIETGQLPPTVNILEKYHGAETAPEKTNKKQNTPKI